MNKKLAHLVTIRSGEEKKEKEGHKDGSKEEAWPAFVHPLTRTLLNSLLTKLDFFPDAYNLSIASESGTMLSTQNTVSCHFIARPLEFH